MKTANRIVMTLASGVLIFATVFKVNQVLREPILSKGFWESREFYIIQIPLLLGLAIWLICGIFRKAGWLLGITAFAVFSCDTLYKMISGSASCGCFGTVQVDPKVTLFAINLPILALLIAFGPKGEKLLPPPWPKWDHFFGVALPTFMLLGLLAGVMIKIEPPIVTEKYELVQEKDWKGSVLPMIEYTDIADQISEGLWVLFFYHHDCPNCREMMPVYDEMNEMLIGNEDAINFAFIEMPPYGPSDDSPVPAGTKCLLGKLDERKKWYGTSPIVIAVQDGIVLGGWQINIPESLDELLHNIMTESPEAGGN